VHRPSTWGRLTMLSYTGLIAMQPATSAPLPPDEQEDRAAAINNLKPRESASAYSSQMERLFDKKSKKSFQSSQRHTSLGIPTNTAVGPFGFRVVLDIGLKGEQDRSCPGADRSDRLTVTPGEEDARASRIVFRETKSEGQALPIPETSVTGAVVGDKYGNCPLGGYSRSLPSRPMFTRTLLPEKNADDTEKGEGGPEEGSRGMC